MENDNARPRLIRALSRVVPLILIAAMPVAVTAASGGGTGTGDSGGDRYDRLWEDLSKKNKRWARRTSECESGRDKNAHGGGGRYHGAFQFLLSTWRNAPKSPGGDPHRYRWRVQAVVAVYLKKREGTSPWPVCG